MKLPGVVLATIETACNRLIAEQPDIVPGVLMGKSVCIDLSGIDIQLYYRFLPDHIVVLGEFDAEPDATISGTPTALVFAGLSGRGHTRDLQLTGDLQVAQAFEKFLKDIDPDWEEWLSHYTGDAIAFQAGETARSLQRWGQQATKAFQEDLRDYLQIEINMLPVAPEVDSFNRSVDEFRAAVERFEMRVHRLQRKQGTAS